MDHAEIKCQGESWVTIVPAAQAQIAVEVAKERQRQDAMWGEQNWPSAFEDERRREIARAMEKECKSDSKRAFDEGTGTWSHIAAEEFWESVAAPDDAARRAELVQLAAVVVAWIECIDRRAAAAREQVTP